MSLALAVALAGGIGACLRFVVDGLISRRSRRTMPVGTLTINVTGAFVLGLLTSLSAHHAGLGDLGTVLGTGMMGGYTTFSTASVEAVNLAVGQGGRGAVRAGVHAVGMLVLGLLAGWLGLALG